VHRLDLEVFLNDILGCSGFSDYGPNGLQVEGRDEIQKVAFAVSATRDSISRAVELGADALIVHHGLFWNFAGAKPLVGHFARRVFPLIRHEINLFAYHLPLDAHPDYGNAARLAGELGVSQPAPFGDYKGRPTGVKGFLDSPIKVHELVQRIEEVVSHPVLLASPDPTALVRSIGIITGGANREWLQAASEGLDAYLTGEMSEHDWHESQEAGIHMFAAGHHATEVFGVRALMAIVGERFGVEVFYIPSENPA
jgi:dinuclear metal center YbgI/SA1388 family protein